MMPPSMLTDRAPGRPDRVELRTQVVRRNREPGPHRVRQDSERRSQLRAVANGTPTTRAATLAMLEPAARAINATPITPTASRRRSSESAGNSTCVRPHDEHRDRRGERQSSPPPDCRTARTRACPHGRSTPPQSHSSTPARSTRSSSTSSIPTIFARGRRAPGKDPLEVAAN